MRKPSFDKSSLETARGNLIALFGAYVAATGIPAAIVSEIVSDDRAFYYRFQKSSISFATYDRVAGRFSSIWPAGAEWPAFVPHPKPETLPPKALAKLEERLAIAAKKTSPVSTDKEASNG